MSEALWAQVISGFFGLATIVASTYLPRRINRAKDEERRAEDSPDESQVPR